jgi:autotransporter-associated beta strand protein
VTADLSAIGGSTTQALVLAGSNVYTNSWTVSATTPLTTVTITATATDSLGNPGSGSTSLTLQASTVTWNGVGSGTWTDNTDWVGNQGPGLFGSTVIFQGSAGLTSTMNNSYNITSLTFTNGAGSFNIGTATSSTLTISAGGVTNNSTSAETLNVPVVLTASETLNAAAGDLTLSQSVASGANLLTLADGGHNLAINGPVSGTGGLTKNGSGTNTLSGTNTFTGTVTINAGTLAVSGSGVLNNGGYANPITNNGTLYINSSTNQILSGVISGTGALVKNNTGILTNTAANTFTGNVTVNNGTLVAATTVNLPTGVAGPLGNATVNTRTITVNGPGILDLQINNVFGQLSSDGTKNASPPPLVINGGILQCEKASDLLGPLTLNGATVIANCASSALNYRPAGYLNSYLSYQLGGDVTVTGNSPSVISNTQTSFGAPQDGFSLTNGATTFTVADVTGDANVDLTIQAAIADVNQDYAPTGAKIPGVLVKAGPGTMLLSGLNFYSGGTIVSAGTLVAGTTDNQALPAGGSAAYAGLGNAAGAFGSPISTITLGNANTTIINSSPSLLIGGAFAVNHPIVVANQVTTGTYTIGGSTNANASFGGTITLNQPLTVSQVANTAGNALTISNGITAGSGTPTVTFAGAGNINVTNAPIANGSGTLGVKVAGATVTLSTVNTYTGNTTISAGSLNLTGSASLTSPNIIVGGGAKFDVSGTAGFTLSSQTLSNSTSTATLAGNITTASGTVSLTYASGTPAFTVTNGTLTLSSATTFKVNNTGAALGGGSYKLISTNLNGTGFIAGTVPSSVSVVGLASGATAVLQINNGELYLNVTGSAVNTHAGPLQTTIIGSTLKLGWPTNSGWTLLTNSVDLANASAWHPYPSSATLTNVDITLDPSKTNVFFKLVNPYP